MTVAVRPGLVAVLALFVAACNEQSRAVVLSSDMGSFAAEPTF